MERIGHVLLNFFCVCLLLAFIPSCRHRDAVESSEKEQKNIRHRSARFLLDQYGANKFDFDWLGMKLSATYTEPESELNFNATIRMRKDSVIWVSVTPMLGIEVIRMMLTPDSLFFLSKAPGNEFIYRGPFSELCNLTQTQIEFDMLQDLFIGNALALETDERRFRSEEDGGQHLLISKYRRKVRRMVGVDDSDLINDTLYVDPNDPRYLKAIRKVDEDGLIISRYWLDPVHYRLEKSIFNDLLRSRTMEIEYTNFQFDGEQVYPTVGVLMLDNFITQRKMQYEITRLSSGKPYDFPFEVSSNYPIRDSL
ncbi:MAG: DUF4292 domain-containing protein [Flavobacteriales bacterium]